MFQRKVQNWYLELFWQHPEGATGLLLTAGNAEGSWSLLAALGCGDEGEAGGVRKPWGCQGLQVRPEILYRSQHKHSPSQVEKGGHPESQDTEYCGGRWVLTSFSGGLQDSC